MAARQTITIRLHVRGTEAIDELRGSWSRSEWIRRACQEAIKRGLRGPKEGGL